MNQSQARFLNTHGLTEATIATADPAMRLEFANHAADPDPASAPVAETTSQKAYREQFKIDDISKADDAHRYMYGKLATIRTTSAEVPAKTIAALLDWRTAKLDSSKLANETADFRLHVANTFDEALRAGPAKATEEQSLIVHRYAA